jgi:outer membrane protein assembly factor BamC
MKHYRKLLIAMTMLALVGCSVLPSLDDVLPDKRTEYKKSDSLPELEVPPDLTSQTINDSMAIPNEEASLSQMQRQRAAETPVAAAPDEQWVSVRQPRADMWPRLRAYFEKKGYPIDVDDAELGVLETGWGSAITSDSGVQRLKYRVFSEPGATPEVTVLFISSQRQSQAKGGGDAANWVDKDADIGGEKVIAGELNQIFNGASVATGAAPATATGATAAAVAPTAKRPAAELRDAGDGRILLALPDEYSLAWPRTDKALQRGGFFVEAKDEAKGLYQISYFKTQEKEKKGWLSKMKFWDNDEEKGQSFSISLTGVGRKTEMIVMNKDGEWDSGEDAKRILTIIQSQYGVE